MGENNNSGDHKDKSMLLPTCIKCGVPLNDENWYASKKRDHSRICKKCNNKQSKEWQQDNRDRYNQLVKKWQQNNKDRCNQLVREENQRLRDEVIDAYGGECACCGETRKEYLTIDHIDGNGNKQKREIGVKDSRSLYRWLRQNNYPEGFQVLCFNCNCGKGSYSVCPHNSEIFEKEFGAKLKESKSARYGWTLRTNIIEGYGGKCELCGEDNPHFLTIDHINGDGSIERKMIGDSYALYRKLRDNNYPRDNYRLLCYNCNCALGCKRITEDEIKLSVGILIYDSNRKNYYKKSLIN